MGSDHPLAGVVVQPTAGSLGVVGAAPAASAGGGGGGGGRSVLAFTRPRAVHRMWWTDDPFYLYEVRLLPPAKGPEVTFRLAPEERGATAGGGRTLLVAPQEGRRAVDRG